MNTSNVLTNAEYDALPIIISELRMCKRSAPVKSDQLTKNINTRFRNKNMKFRVNGVRLRRFCNHIRSESLLPVIATSKGYYTTRSQDEIRQQVVSLQERSHSISRSAKGLQKFLTK